eukprot:jgi/Chlat1/3850/Chrsp26S04153
MARRGEESVPVPGAGAGSVDRTRFSAKDLVDQAGLRGDGRAAEECRPPFLRTGVVSRAAGSAYAEFGNTKLIAAVYGPRESTKAAGFSTIGRLHCDVKVTSFASTTRGKFGQGPEERDLSSLLLTALEPSVALHTFPKSVVDVYVLILESGGADAAVAVTCASMALAHAGIALHDLVAACCVSCVNGQLLLDPTAVEQRCEDGGLLLAMMPVTKQVTQLVLTGNWPEDSASEAIELSQDGCSSLDDIMRQYLRQQYEASESDKATPAATG